MGRCVQDRNRTLCIEVNTTFERPSVNMLPPCKCKTFKHYAEAVFLPYVINYGTQNVKRIDLVWDRYLQNSLNQGTHEARGTRTRRRVCVGINEEPHITDVNKAHISCFRKVPETLRVSCQAKLQLNSTSRGQHSYETCQFWGQTLVSIQELSSAADWG